MNLVRLVLNMTMACGDFKDLARRAVENFKI